MMAERFADWELQGPDDEGHVWFVAENSGFNLGPLDQALAKLAAFLAANDYEERGLGLGIDAATEDGQ
jgi:anti-sigma regulatory factor (Ser/Thr protein kinase)